MRKQSRKSIIWLLTSLWRHFKYDRHQIWTQPRLGIQKDVCKVSFLYLFAFRRYRRRSKGGQLYALPQRLAGGAEAQRLPGYLGVLSSCYIGQILVRAHFFSWYSRVRTSQNEERFKISGGAFLLLAFLWKTLRSCVLAFLRRRCVRTQERRNALKERTCPALIAGVAEWLICFMFVIKINIDENNLFLLEFTSPRHVFNNFFIFGIES